MKLPKNIFLLDSQINFSEINYSNNKDFQNLIESVDIGNFIDPKAITVSSILMHIRRGHIRRLHTLSDGSAEIIEGEVSASSDMVGPTIQELDLPKGLRIGGIFRDNKVIMPQGDTKIKEGDYVVKNSVLATFENREKLKSELEKKENLLATNDLEISLKEDQLKRFKLAKEARWNISPNNILNKPFFSSGG